MSSLGLVVAMVCLGTSCGRSPSATPPSESRKNLAARPGEILATVAGKPITLSRFQAEWNRRAQSSAGALAAIEQKRALLEEMIRFEVLLARAREAGLDRDADFTNRVNRLLVAQYQEEQLARFSAASQVTEPEIREFYQANPGRFASPESIRVAVIFIGASPKASPDNRAALKDRVEQIRATALRADAMEFGRLAQQYSEDQATRYAGGDAGWLRRNTPGSRWDSAVTQAAFRLDRPGEISPVIEARVGFYLIRLTEKNPRALRPLDQVTEAIHYQLSRDKQRQLQLEFFEEIKRGLQIEINESALEAIPAPDNRAAGSPPRLPDG